jgi:hypothetical protein
MKAIGRTIGTMKKYSFTLELPEGTPPNVAYNEGLAHIKDNPYADYAVHGSKPSTPGMRTFTYIYKIRRSFW